MLPVAAPGLRILGAFEGQTHMWGGGEDRIFKKVLLSAHAVVTGISPLPQEIRTPLKRGAIFLGISPPGGEYPRNIAPQGGEYPRYIAPL